MEEFNEELVENTNLEKGTQDKSKKLLEKIELLSQKIEQEKSPLKRHIFAFRVKMLIAKIQREIDIQNLKDSYEGKRKDLLEGKEKRETSSLDNIAVLTTKIKAMQREINGNEEHDPESPFFMYPKNYVEQSGGIENLINRLKESDKVESQQAAKRIGEIALKRQELNQLYDELRQEQENLEYSQEDYEEDKDDLDVEEKSLVFKQKFNIFSRIGDFFRNLTGQVKEYREEKRQMKDLTTRQKEDEIAIEEEFERRMEELKEEHEKAKQEIRDRHQGERGEQQSQLGQDTAANFRKQMAEMSKGQNADVTQDTSSQSTPQQDQTQEPARTPENDEEVSL